MSRTGHSGDSDSVGDCIGVGDGDGGEVDAGPSRQEGGRQEGGFCSIAPGLSTVRDARAERKRVRLRGWGCRAVRERANMTSTGSAPTSEGSDDLTSVPALCSVCVCVHCRTGLCAMQNCIFPAANTILDVSKPAP